MTVSLRILQGDCREVLATLPAESVHCIVTSPPFYGLRDYKTAGQIGLEDTWPEYVAQIVSIFRELRRILRHDGTAWVNLGDSFATGAGRVGRSPGGGEQGARWAGYRGDHGRAPKQATGALGPVTQPNRMPQPALKPKDLMMMPHRTAIALQDDGWWIRGDIVWHKPNPMPESVTDRPTRAHEYIFLMSKSERYVYDAAAIREPAKGPTTKMPDGWDTGAGAHGRYHRDGREHGLRVVDKQRGHGRRHAGFNDRWDGMPRAEQTAMRANRRDVWTVATQGFPGAHFATYPEKLIEPCILAGCPEGGTVLDPFAGSGTTGAVALRSGRNAILIELNPDYCRLIEQRCSTVTPRLPLEAGEEAV